MTLQTILDIIKLTLELANKVVADMPSDQKAAFWDQHQKNVDFWRGLLDKAKDRVS